MPSTRSCHRRRRRIYRHPFTFREAFASFTVTIPNAGVGSKFTPQPVWSDMAATVYCSLRIIARWSLRDFISGRLRPRLRPRRTVSSVCALPVYCTAQLGVFWRSARKTDPIKIHFELTYAPTIARSLLRAGGIRPMTITAVSKVITNDRDGCHRNDNERHEAGAATSFTVRESATSISLAHVA